jgi:hypothetical protein
MRDAQALVVVLCYHHCHRLLSSGYCVTVVFLPMRDDVTAPAAVAGNQKGEVVVKWRMVQMLWVYHFEQ